MKLYARCHGYLPVHRAGSEVMLHAILRYLVAQGHEVRVSCTQPHLAQTCEVDGISVLAESDRAQGRELLQWCDVALTHHGMTRPMVAQARKWQKPLVHLVHNTTTLPSLGITKADLVLWNSEWVRDFHQWKGGPGVVVYPPVAPKEYKTKPGDRVTLVNLCEAKGGKLFWQLAEEMPDVPYLAVKGAYEHQVIPDEIPPNAELQDTTSDMVGDVYSRTRIVLMPSSYESWGRVAIEAASSGIPVIAHPTPGLKEALGDAGIFVDRADVEGWKAAIHSLDTKTAYAAASKKVRTRALELEKESARQLVEVEAALCSLAERSQRRRERQLHRVA